MIIAKKILTHDFPLYTHSKLKNDHGIVFCFTTRKGGYSRGELGSLNVDYNVGDSRTNVKKNREVILNKIGLEKSKKIYSVKQVHGKRIFNLDRCGEYDSDEIPEEADCIITTMEDTPIMVMGADCNLILIADTSKRIVAAVHAGWKGTLHKLVTDTVLFMKDIYGSNMDDLIVSFGPSIRSCCYRVRGSLLRRFTESFGNGNFFEQRSGSFFLDLAELNYIQLRKLGVKKENITDCSVCTCCTPGFFSYRRNKVTGRQGAIAVIESG